MAGDWIKFELSTLNKPEVIALADLLGTTRDDVVGKLIRIWAWFDQQTIDGNAVCVTDSALQRFIDEHVGSQGFSEAMVKVRWLTASGIPNFERHNGESAKKRALTNERVKRHRNGKNVTPALPEKRREEKKKTPISPTGDSPGFTRFWTTWPESPRKVGKAKCRKLWVSAKCEAAVEVIVGHVEAMAASKQWQDGFEPAPTTYLGQRRWEDGPPSGSAADKLRDVFAGAI